MQASHAPGMGLETESGLCHFDLIPDFRRAVTLLWVTPSNSELTLGLTEKNGDLEAAKPDKRHVEPFTFGKSHQQPKWYNRNEIPP